MALISSLILLFNSIFEFFQASAADIFFVINENVLLISAENAGGIILFQDDTFSLYIYFKRIPEVNTQCSSEFYRQNYSSQFVYFSYYTCWFHTNCSFQFITIIIYQKQTQRSTDNLLIFCKFRHIFLFKISLQCCIFICNMIIWFYNFFLL